MPASVYLDSSALVKRYVEESGTKVMEDVLREAALGKVHLGLSMWNIGEVLGALQRRARVDHRDREFPKLRARVHGEIERLNNLGSLTVLPVSSRRLRMSWGILERHKLYVADALQIVSARDSKADLFLTGDRRLRAAAELEGLVAYDVERDSAEITDRLGMPGADGSPPP